MEIDILKNNTLKEKNKNYIHSFDGLRAIAVILVILYHLSPHIFSGGYLAVIIFLVLSGYLVTDNFIKEIDTNIQIDILKFWKRRLIKLYTPLLPLLTIVSLMILFFFDNMLNGYVGNLFSTLFGINNIYQIVNGLSYFESHGNFNPFTHLWSLGLEMQFYLIWPIVIAVLYGTFKIKGKKLAIIIFFLSFLSSLLMFLLYKPNIDLSRIYYGTDTRAFGFLIGAFFAILFPRKKVFNLEITKAKKIILDIFSILIFLVIVYTSIVLNSQFSFVYKFGMYLYSILVGILLILILIKNNIMNKFLSLSLFEMIGQRSYSLYLWQYTIMIFISSKFAWSKISNIKLFIIELIISIIIAEISYRFFENKRNYLKYIDKNDDLVNKNIAISVFILSAFIIFSTSITSLSNKHNEINDLKSRIAQIEKAKNNNTNEEKITLKEEKIKENKEKIDVENLNITFIGDSVMLCAQEDIKNKFKNSNIDAKVSRQYWDLPKVLENLKKNNNIKDIVVIHLGTNYSINKKEFTESLKSIGNKKIFLINCIVTNSWEEQVNKTLKEISDEMDNVNLIDWYGFAKGKKELFYQDATHPNVEGAKEYTNLLKKDLEKYLNN